MINQWIKWINVCIILITIGICIAAGNYWYKKPDSIETSFSSLKEPGLPKTAFELPLEVYDEISGPLLALESEPPSLQVPDLKGQLLFYGKNGRPDAQKNYTILHFALTSHNKNIASIKPNEPLYLVFDRSTNPGKYVFSPNNEKTSLWIEATPVDNEVLVTVTFENDKGELITEPQNHSKFRLAEKEFSRTSGTTWEIASFKVDGTLLARQKARWYGPDRFLENHGGKDFNHVVGKQRIDFCENEDIYSVFIKTGDTLIWENQWKVVEPGEASLGRPLLVVKKVDERLMSFELWDVEGKSKIILNVLKTSEPWTMQNAQVLKTMFKFLGARTRTQSVFEINGERMLLSPSDWLLLTPKGWVKLTNEKEIDDYVKRKLTGTLFIFEGVSRKDDRLAMLGTLYSPSRHEAQTISIPMQAENKAKQTSKETQDPKEKELKDAKEVADLIGEILAPLNRQENDVKHLAETRKTSTAVQTKK